MSKRIPSTARRGVRAAVASVLLAAALAVPAIHAASPASVDVDIAKFLFTAKEVTVAPGTKVVWTNHDDTPHSVVANDKSFSSKGLDTDDKFEHTFTREGDFGYICSVHPFMTGVVHVRKP
jgi:plastocyanin